MNVIVQNNNPQNDMYKVFHGDKVMILYFNDRIILTSNDSFGNSTGITSAVI